MNAWKEKKKNFMACHMLKMMMDNIPIQFIKIIYLSLSMFWYACKHACIQLAMGNGQSNAISVCVCVCVCFILYINSGYYYYYHHQCFFLALNIHLHTHEKYIKRWKLYKIRNNVVNFPIYLSIFQCKKFHFCPSPIWWRKIGKSYSPTNPYI